MREKELLAPGFGESRTGKSVIDVMSSFFCILELERRKRWHSTIKDISPSMFFPMHAFGDILTSHWTDFSSSFSGHVHIASQRHKHCKLAMQWLSPSSSFRKCSVLIACPQMLDPFYNIFCFIFESISGALFSGTGGT